MINYKIILRVLGSLLYGEAVTMLICMVVALCYKEDDILLFASSAIITVFAGAVLKFWGRKAENRLSRRDAYLLVSLVWIIYSLFATLPFLLGGYLHSFTDAYFEAMSGFTTTGATIIDDVEVLPHGILTWRSLTQWVGGLGIVFTVIALIPSVAGGSGSIRVFGAESTGMDWFDAANFTMSSVATGGFSTYNDSTEYFHSPSLEYVTTFFCFLSGTNFTLLYLTIFKRKWKSMFKDSEFRV